MGSSTSTEVESDVRVVTKELLAEGVVMIELALPEGAELPGWTPGSHIDVILDGGIERQYSLCGDPADRTVWRIAVLREADSRGGSSRVHDRLQVGDTVQVRGPRNHFELVPAPRYLFVAGGIGITPIIPMMATAEAGGAEWQLVYGGRSRRSMAFVGELEERYPGRIEIMPQDERGLLPLGAIAEEPRSDTLVYCCGPEPLLSAMEQACGQWPAGALHVERFTPKQVEAFDPDSSFVIELAASGGELTVHPGETILDVLLDHGIEVDTSCTEGICGTCETRVLGGIPDHLDSVLTPQEQAANDTMFVCVSRSRSPRLVLDL